MGCCTALAVLAQFDTVDTMARNSRDRLHCILVVSLLLIAGCLEKEAKTVAITAQPADSAVTEGTGASFEVVAAGDAPLSYQWQKNSAAINGATASTYTTPATALADSGSAFSVVVTNASGAVTSRAAALTVSPAVVGNPGTLTVETIDRAGVKATHFFAYQDGDGPWLAHTAQSPGHHEIAITNAAGRYSVAYADADTLPRNLGPTTIPLNPLTFAGAIVQATLAEGSTITVPLGPAPFDTVICSEGGQVLSSNSSVQLRLPGDVRDFGAGATLQSYETAAPARLFIPGATYTGYAQTLPFDATTVFLVKVKASTCNTSLEDFGEFAFSGTGGPPTLAPPDATVRNINVQNAPTDTEDVNFRFGFYVPLGHSDNLVTAAGVPVTPVGGAAMTSVHYPAIMTNSWSDAYTFGADTVDLGANNLNVLAYAEAGADVHLTLPAPFVMAAAAVDSGSSYPRIRQPLTTQVAGTVHTLSIGRSSKEWAVYATTAWFGGAGKNVIWEFPDFSALSDWNPALWTTWTTGTSVSVTGAARICGSLQHLLDTTIGARDVQHAGDVCTSAENDGSNVNL